MNERMSGGVDGWMDRWLNEWGLVFVVVGFMRRLARSPFEIKYETNTLFLIDFHKYLLLPYVRFSEDLTSCLQTYRFSTALSTQTD